ncbi:FAD-binding protein, partial [Bosea thiooxidans]
MSVKGGGHDPSGRALTDGGLVLDLTRMRQVIVDPHTQVATVQGGAMIRDVI